jgi:hypothetical protein
MKHSRGQGNNWQQRVAISALPMVHSKNKDALTQACLAVSYGVMDMAPADPVEGILIAGMMAPRQLQRLRQEWSRWPRHRAGF